MGALPLAVDYVNGHGDLLPGRTLEYYAVNIGSDAAVLSSNTIKYIQHLLELFPRRNFFIFFLFLMSLPRNMTDLMIKEGVIAFIGPDESCLYEALVASAWNLPMISYVSRRQMEQLIDDGSKFCNK